MCCHGNLKSPPPRLSPFPRLQAWEGGVEWGGKEKLRNSVLG